MSNGPRKPKAVRPIFLPALGFALAGFGLISGMALDVATRPPELQPFRSAKPKPVPASQFSSSLAELPSNVRPERTVGESVRAWAPEMPARDIPMVAFAVRSPAPAGQPVIAIVIDDMGLDRPRSLRMVEL